MRSRPGPSDRGRGGEGGPSSTNDDPGPSGISEALGQKTDSGRSALGPGIAEFSSPREAEVLRSLLDADEVTLAVPIRVELLSGASTRDRPRLRRALSALPVVYPSDDTWRRIEQWVDRAGEAGQRFGLGDLLIGALAAESAALIWSLDADFACLERLGLVERYEP